jgi:hypothetical protein
MHELLLFYLLGHRASLGYWAAFFMAQAPSVLAEAAAPRWARVPPPLAVPTTLSALLVLGHFLFFPPVLHTGLLKVLLRNCSAGYASVTAALFWWG